MAYELKYEGISPDEALEDKLLLQCRRVVVDMEPESVVKFIIRQIDGKIQARVEVVYAGKRLSVVVWRNDPEAALGAAVDATMEAAASRSMVGPIGVIGASSALALVNTLQ